MPCFIAILLSLAAAASVAASPSSHKHAHLHYHTARAGGPADAQHYNSTTHKTVLTEPEPEMGIMAMNYKLRDSYTASNFFNEWDFFQGADPTHGYVNYVDQGTAWNERLIGTENGQIRMSVDSTNVASGSGRKSVRLTSKKAYNRGLFIADIAHMPGAACGAWPAFWLFGPNWPYSGEIDIIEGVNLQATNAITLHTSPGCVMNTVGSSGSTLTEPNCNANNGFNGCSVSTINSQNYGNGFNNIGGGVYATQWESSGIYVWFFPRNAIPADINARQPNTQNWGLPLVAFNGGAQCDVNARFKDLSIVFDTTFCGDWAGGVFGSQCGYTGQSCQQYVQYNPGAFANSYWKVNYVNVYQLG